MMWITVVAIVAVVGVLVALRMPGSKDRKPSTDGHMTTEEMSAAQRDMWERTERAVRAYADARGAAVEPARERMLQAADEVDDTIKSYGVQGASERQMAMWRLAAVEIREFVNDALAHHPEGPRK